MIEPREYVHKDVVPIRNNDQLSLSTRSLARLLCSGHRPEIVHSGDLLNFEIRSRRPANWRPQQLFLVMVPLYAFAQVP